MELFYFIGIVNELFKPQLPSSQIVKMELFYFIGIVNELFKPQLPSSQIVKMGIDVNDIGEVPVVQQTKRQSSTGNGQLLGNAQTNLDNKQSSNAKKEGEKFNPAQEMIVLKCITLSSRTAIQCRMLYENCSL